MPDPIEGLPVRRRITPYVFAMLVAATSAAAMDQKLDNGLRVILMPHRANPMVASAVIVGAGVVDEPPRASGASHFLEHLLFNGTTTRTVGGSVRQCSRRRDSPSVRYVGEEEDLDAFLYASA